MDKRQYKCPESVLVIVYTAAGEVLLLQRRHPPDFWQSVTGALEWDESPRDAACRELREETGLDMVVRDCHRTNQFAILPAWRERYAPGTETNLENVFTARCEQRPDIVLNPPEHRAFEWLPRQVAASRASSSANRDAIREFVPQG